MEREKNKTNKTQKKKRRKKRRIKKHTHILSFKPAVSKE
jgi:hypothetical protein